MITRTRSVRAGVAAIGLLLFAFSASVVWFVVTEPLFCVRADVDRARIDPGRLETHVRMLAEKLTPRDWDHPENLDRAAAYIWQAFESAGGQVREQAYDMGGRVYRNVIAEFGPPSGELTVVGAHYDAAGRFPGADDNASGVAGLIELAHALGGLSLQRRVELVAFTLEEPATSNGPGLFRGSFGGSAVHAASLRQQNARVRVVLNLEMIGFFRDESGSQRFPLAALGWIYPDQGNFITVVGTFGQGRAVRRVKGAIRAATSLPVHSMSAPAFLKGIDWSDHTNYWNAGYDAVMVTDTSFYRNPNYHTAEDRPVTLDYVRMAQVVEGLAATVQVFAAGE